MALPKKLSTGVRYLPASAYNCYVTFLQPNAGQQADGTPNPSTVVASNIHCNWAQWRGKEADKTQTRDAVSSYKIIVRYPRTYSLDSGMQMQITRGGSTHLLNIESMSDPDMQGVELHIWGWEENATS